MGRRGRGTAGKIPVFGFLNRDWTFYTKIIPDASGETPAPTLYNCSPHCIPATSSNSLIEAAHGCCQITSYSTISGDR